MELGALCDLVLDVNFDLQGVPATVTLPGQAAIDTRVFLLGKLMEDNPVGKDFERREPRRVIAIKRDVVANVPRGTIIVAPEKPGGTERSWQIDGMQSTERDHYRIIVIPETA